MYSGRQKQKFYAKSHFFGSVNTFNSDTFNCNGGRELGQTSDTLYMSLCFASETVLNKLKF